MDIAPVITPGTTAPAADATGAVAAVPTAPGQAFSDLFAVALGGADAPTPVPAITPATAVVTIPVAIAVPSADPTVPSIPTDVPAVNPARIAVLGDAPPLSVTDPPESPPEIPSISRKDAQATAPNAPAIWLDQPEKNQEPTEASPTDAPQIDPATASVVASLTGQTAVVQASVVTASNDQVPDPSTAETKSSVGQTAATSTVPILDNAPVASPAPAIKAPSAPVAKSSAPSNPTTTKKASAVADGAPVKSRAKRGAQSDEVAETPALETDSDSQLTESTPVATPDAPALAERVSETAVPTVLSSDNTPLPKAATDITKLAAAPDLGVVPIVTVNTPIAEPIKAAVKEVAPDANGSLAIGETAVKAPEIKAPEAKVVEKGSDSNFAEALVEAAVKGGKDSSDTGDQTSKDQPSADPTPVAPASVRSAATDRPEAGADRPEIDRHLVVRQVADRIENMVAARPRDGVTIHLEPRDLGTVTLVVKGLSSALDVQVSASDTRVREGLEASRNDLAQALAPRGIELRDVRIVTSSSSGSGSGQASKDGGSNPNPDGRPRQQASNSHQTGFTQSSSRPTRTSGSRGSRRTGGVDLLA